ncbi:MAG: hypothetical protein R3B70_49355 [Polyangiaceae bacterium]
MSRNTRWSEQVDSAVKRRKAMVANEVLEGLGAGKEREAVRRALEREGMESGAAELLAGSWKSTSHAEKRDLVPPRFRPALERIIGSDDLLGIEFLEIMTRLSRSVGRIVTRGAATDAVGTGFLLPGGLLMTNHHVFSDPAEASQCAVQFDYQLDT